LNKLRCSTTSSQNSQKILLICCRKETNNDIMSKNTKQSTYNMFVTIPRKSNAITHIWDLTSSSPYSTRHLALYFPTYKLTIILRVKKIYMFTTNINIYILSICLWVPVVFKFEILICLTHKQCKYGFYQKIVCTRKSGRTGEFPAPTPSSNQVSKSNLNSFSATDQRLLLLSFLLIPPSWFF